MKNKPERNRMVKGTIRRADDAANTGWTCPVCRKVNAPHVLSCDHDVLTVEFPAFIIVQKDNADAERKARGPGK